MVRGGRTGRRGWWPAVVLSAIVLAAQMVLPWDSRGLWAQQGSNTDAELVYLDSNRVIRILDPAPAFEGVNLTWSSPQGGWKSFVLGDVTGDSDDEIIAVRDDGDAGHLTIYDPVAVDAPDDLVQYLDDVPWATLFDLALPGPPLLVGVGEFDTGRTGAEIVYAYTLPAAQRTAEDVYQFVILRAATDAADGRAWEALTTWNTGNKWTWLATGNLDGSGIDEIALVANEIGNLSIYQVTNDGFNRLYRNSNSENEWRAVEFGQYNAGGVEELTAVRAADYPLASAWIFRWANNDIQDVYAERFIPSPRLVFWADIAGNGDDEIVMLRNVPQELGTRARLIIRDNGNDTKSMTEATLDADNGYTSGAGGDFDGDGRDEIAVSRTNRIRIFTEPESSADVDDYDLNNTADILKAGNLDGEGLARSPRLGANVTQINFTVRAGTASDPQTVRVTDAATGSAIPVAGSLQNASSWANWSFSSTSTPVDVSVFANAAGMQPGIYVDHVLVDAQADGIGNDPLSIGLTLTVESGITPTPDFLAFNYYPCEEAELRTIQVQLSGEAGTLYSTQITGGPAWVTVTPITGELPEAATVTVDPALRPSDVADAVLVVSVDWPGAPDTQEKIPILLVCGHARVLLPLAFGPP